MNLQNLQKFYLHVPKKGVVAEIQEYFGLHLTEIFREFHRSGGGDNDVFEVTAELREYLFRGGWMQLYTVVYKNAHGYAEHISVLHNLYKPEEETSERVQAFLEHHKFVSNHTLFRKRPPGFFKSFQDYLDRPYKTPKNSPFYWEATYRIMSSHCGDAPERHSEFNSASDDEARAKFEEAANAKGSGWDDMNLFRIDAGELKTHLSHSEGQNEKPAIITHKEV